MLYFIKFFMLLFLALLIIIFIYPVGYFVFAKNDKIIQNIEYTNSSNLSGVGVYVINLDRSKERYNYIISKVRDLGYNYHRISAIDGTSLEESEINKNVDFSSYKSFFAHYPKKGTIGCSLSHIKAWKEFLNSEYEYALILEDDVSFSPKKLREVIEELQKIPTNWDIVNLEVYHRGMPLTLKNLDSGNKLVVYLFEVTHAGAYLISRKSAFKLLEKSIPIKMPIDHFYTRSWEFGLKFTGIESPRLVFQTYGDSEIETSKRYQKTDSSMFCAKLTKLIYKIQSNLIRVLYNFKIWISYKL